MKKRVMKKLYLYLAVLLAPCLSYAQVIEDYLPEDTTTADCCSFSFLYMKVAAGYDHPNKHLILIAPYSPLGIDTAMDIETKSKIPTYYKLGIGYDFGRLRTELEASTSMIDVEDFEFTYIQTADEQLLQAINDSTETYGNLSHTRIMANALYEFNDEYSLFQPYIGLGAGASVYGIGVTIKSNLEEQGSSDSLRIGGNTTFIPVGQIIIGFNTNINDDLFIDLSYNFLSSFKNKYINVADIYQLDRTEHKYYINLETEDGKQPLLNHIFELGFRIPIRK